MKEVQIKEEKGAVGKRRKKPKDGGRESSERVNRAFPRKP